MNDRDEGKSTGTGAVVGAAVGGVAAGATTGALAGGITGPVGAALGAVVGAVIGAFTGHGAKAAHDSDSHAGAIEPTGAGHDTQSLHTVIGAFDDRSTADRAVERLVQSGFPRTDVHVEHGAGGQGMAAGASDHNQGFFPGLFEMDHDTGRARNAQFAPHADTYQEAVRRGGAVVVVDTHGESEAERATEMLHEAGAVDVDERSQQWRAEGWAPSSGLPAQTVSGDTATRGNEQVLDVVQEELQVGKRTMDRGGVRVVQRVSSRPVHELVRLREEHAVVDRHPVDRPAQGQELTNFKEGTLEVRESVEQPVVAKTARVVEEVRVGKEVREREETIEDTVRRKDVEVQRLSGQGERERAVASGERIGKDKPTQ